MCIICNMPDMEVECACQFLTAFEMSQQHMRAAKHAMLVCSQKARDPEHRRRYDATHKRMTRLIAEWNRLEEFRENHPIPNPPRAALPHP